MELRYCEECGDVIRLDSNEPASLQDRFVCTKCEGGEAPATRTESPGTRSEDFSAENLDLFSSGSIALRKQEAELGLKRAPEARLRLVKTTKTPVADAEPPAEPAFPGAAPTPEPSVLL